MDDMRHETGKLNISVSTWASYHIVELQATTELILEDIRDLEVLGTNLPQKSYTFWEW